jgi:hypothetical protein
MSRHIVALYFLSVLFVSPAFAQKTGTTAKSSGVSAPDSEMNSRLPVKKVGMRFRVAIGPGKTESFKIEEFHPEETQYVLGDLDDDEVKLISEQPLTPTLRNVLHRVLDQKNPSDGFSAQVTSRQQRRRHNHQRPSARPREHEGLKG